MMMSAEIKTEEKFAKEFLAAKKVFEEIGFELVGTNDISDDHTLYFVKKKK